MRGLRKLQCARVLRIFRNLSGGRDDMSCRRVRRSLLPISSRGWRLAKSEGLATEEAPRGVWVLKIRFTRRIPS